MQSQARNAKHGHWMLEEARKGSPLEPSEEAHPCPHLDLGLSVSRGMSEYIPLALSHAVCCNLLQQPQETNMYRTHKIYKVIVFSRYDFFSILMRCFISKDTINLAVLPIIWFKDNKIWIIFIYIKVTQFQQIF